MNLNHDGFVLLVTEGRRWEKVMKCMNIMHLGGSQDDQTADLWLHESSHNHWSSPSTPPCRFSTSLSYKSRIHTLMDQNTHRDGAQISAQPRATQLGRWLSAREIKVNVVQWAISKAAESKSVWKQCTVIMETAVSAQAKIKRSAMPSSYLSTKWSAYEW